MENISYKYSIPYLIFLGYLLALMLVEFYKINKQQSTKEVRMLTILGFLFFFGLRGFIDTDWYSYYPYFNSLPTIWGGTSGAATFKSEAGFEIYSILVKSIWNNYHFWVFISTLIDVSILHLVFKRYSKYYVLAFIFFFVFYGEGMETNLMRNVKAILLFMLSIKYLQNRKIIPYMLLNCFGFLFHTSAIVYLPLYFLLHREFSKTILWIIFIVGNIIFLLQLQYIQPIFNSLGDMIGGRVLYLVRIYFSSTIVPYGISIGYLERVCTFVLVMLFSTKLKRQGSNNIFINLFVMYICCFLFFSEIRVVTGRLAILFVCSYWILYPSILSMIQLKNNKYVFIILFTLYSIFKIGTLNKNGLMRYDNILFGIKSFEERKVFFDKNAEKILAH